MTNEPKLSKRAAQALAILADGGSMTHNLERNNYTGREQFQTRFRPYGQPAAKGLGFATRTELERAGFRFKHVHHSCIGDTYKLDRTA